MKLFRVKKIISGGQSGVDRAALDFALAYNIPCGGWCPKGRKAEDGPIDNKYPMQEAKDERYERRTLMNVCGSDATLIFFRKQPDEGTRLTKRLAGIHYKPFLEIDLDDDRKNCFRKMHMWLALHQPKVLNIAGPRESNSPGIYHKSLNFLMEFLEARYD